jgi:hypothetical protein
MYTVVKTIKGRRYLYAQRSWRDGNRIRTESTYLGPLDADIKSNAEPSTKTRPRGIGSFLAAQRLSPEDRAAATAEKQALRVEQEQRERFGETATERADRQRQEHLDKLHAMYGLTLGPANPVPVEPPAAAQAASVSNPAPEAAVAAQTAAASENQAAGAATDSAAEPSADDGQGMGTGAA